MLQELKSHQGQGLHIHFLGLHLLSEELSHFVQVEDGVGNRRGLAQTFAPNEELFLVRRDFGLLHEQVIDPVEFRLGYLEGVGKA